VALATDERGWAALCRAITRIHWDGGGSVRRPHRGTGEPAHGGAGNPPSVLPSFRLSDVLASDRDGLILLSRDPAFLERVLRSSGPRDLYAELVPGKARHAVLAAARRL